MSFGLSSCGYDIRLQDCNGYWDEDREAYFLEPGEFVLGSTVEEFQMPPFVVGIVHDKSTWARKGLAVQNTVIEPGWRGYLTVELTNHSDQTLEIRKGDPIAQVLFHYLDHETEQPYSGKYQDQEKGPQEARFE